MSRFINQYINWHNEQSEKEPIYYDVVAEETKKVECNHFVIIKYNKTLELHIILHLNKELFHNTDYIYVYNEKQELVGFANCNNSLTHKFIIPVETENIKGTQYLIVFKQKVYTTEDNKFYIETYKINTVYKKLLNISRL